MIVRWSPEAADDFVQIVEFIRQDKASAADRVAHKIYESVSLLRNFPKSGRVGRIRNTRELPLTPLPYIVVYRVREEFLEVVRILHGSQRP
jgi:addiction module RelE/StbE family toxin